MSQSPKPLDKRMSAAEVVAQLKDGMTIGIGGWATRRKPMAVVRDQVVDRQHRSWSFEGGGHPSP